MTRKEALAIFEDNETTIENPNYLFTEIGEAWDIAIEALQNNDVQTLENRLKHLLKSRYIAKFDEVNYATGEYVRNIEDADVCFVCDKKACKVCHPETCKYTSEPKHAINFERDGSAGTFFEKLPDNLHWIEKSGLFVCPYCGVEHDTHFNFCGWCGKKVL